MYWSVAQTVGVAHSRSEVSVGGSDANSVSSHDVTASHCLSALSLGAAVWNETPRMQVVRREHSLSDVDVLAAVSYSVAEQTVNGQHLRSLVVVLGLHSYSESLQVERAVHT